MKWIHWFLIVLFAGTLVACGGSGPEAVADKFLSAVEDRDLEEAKTYCTEQTRALLDLVISMGAEAQMEEVPTAHKNLTCEVDESGNRANCTYLEVKEGQEKTENLTLVKEEAGWKVSINKEK